MPNITYIDLGAVQRRESGSATANVSYIDAGALQREEATAASDVYSGRGIARGIGRGVFR